MSDRRPSDSDHPGRTVAHHNSVCMVCGIILHSAAEVRRAIKAAVEFPEGYIVNGALAAIYQASPDHPSICTDCVQRHPERVASLERKRDPGPDEAFAALIPRASPVSFDDERASRISTGMAVTTYRRTLDYPTIESVEAALAWLGCRGLQGTVKHVQVVLGVEYTDRVRHYVKMLRRAEVPLG